MAEGDTTKQPGESVTQFSIRAIMYDAWQQGHDAVCAIGEAGCPTHPNPYRDEAAT